MGTDTTHWRVGTQGMTPSTKCAAVWAMRRPAHDGQKPRRLQLKASRTSCLQVSHPSKRQKGRREAPLSQEAFVCVQTWLTQRADAGVPPTAPLFTRFGAGGRQPTALPLSTVSAWRAVMRKYALQCGLPQIKPHDFRRFVGTELAKRNVRQAQRALGHQRLETTVAHYVLDALSRGSRRGCIERGARGAGAASGAAAGSIGFIGNSHDRAAGRPCSHTRSALLQASRTGPG